jgi:hypothetical protein
VSHPTYDGGTRTGPFRVPGGGEMLRSLARRGVVSRPAAAENGAAGDDMSSSQPTGLKSRVKSPRYRPIPRVTPMRGKQ